jgi:hypothetical protein
MVVEDLVAGLLILLWRVARWWHGGAGPSELAGDGEREGELEAHLDRRQRGGDWRVNTEFTMRFRGTGVHGTCGTDGIGRGMGDALERR